MFFLYYIFKDNACMFHIYSIVIYLIVVDTFGPAMIRYSAALALMQLQGVIFSRSVVCLPHYSEHTMFPSCIPIYAILYHCLQ